MAQDCAYPFVGTFYSAEEATYGAYFPPGTLDPFLGALRSALPAIFAKHLALMAGGRVPPLNTHRLLIPAPILSWTESQQLVIAAFTDFDAGLGARAHRALYDPDRWLLRQTYAGDANGRCLNRNSDLNPHDFAVVEYAYDHTISDPVYVAHELGHLFSFDAMAACAEPYPRAHMAEIQAYFAQHILYGYLARQKNLTLRQAGNSHYVGEVIRNLYDIALGYAVWILERDAVPIAAAQDVFNDTLMGWLGPFWREYAPALRLHGKLDDRHALKTRGIHDLHRHAMSSLIGGGLYAASFGAERQFLPELLDCLYGGRAGSDFASMLQTIGLGPAENLGHFAKCAVADVTEHFADVS